MNYTQKDIKLKFLFAWHFKEHAAFSDNCLNYIFEVCSILTFIKNVLFFRNCYGAESFMPVYGV